MSTIPLASKSAKLIDVYIYGIFSRIGALKSPEPLPRNSCNPKEDILVVAISGILSLLISATTNLVKNPAEYTFLVFPKKPVPSPK